MSQSDDDGIASCENRSLIFAAMPASAGPVRSITDVTAALNKINMPWKQSGKLLCGSENVCSISVSDTQIVSIGKRVDLTNWKPSGLLWDQEEYLYICTVVFSGLSKEPLDKAFKQVNDMATEIFAVSIAKKISTHSGRVDFRLAGDMDQNLSCAFSTDG